MSETIKASQLGPSHIGKIIRVTKGQATAEDILIGFTKQREMIPFGEIFGAARSVPGLMNTTITLQQLGDVECAHYQDVLVVD